jgi:hypothetical protein
LEVSQVGSVILQKKTTICTSLVEVVVGVAQKWSKSYPAIGLDLLDLVHVLIEDQIK